ncbi:MAG TPA: intradiol ring-cleavage dioxygenase [Bryobacteraceae bacterium]|nr:intradiol ring-cleavage dioxygenase [Bryobacteraceae bacterium]
MRTPFLTRRGFIVGGAATFLPNIGRTATPGCTLAAEQEEGPYYVEDEKLRQDITEGHPGMPLRLRVALVDARSCAPLANAAVDIWHCNASGVYSGFTSANPDGGGRGFGPPPGRGFGPPPDGFGPPPGRGRSRQIDETRFLRGVQITNKEGVAQFTTIYPGWYAGRTIHIHLKAHVGGSGDPFSAGHVAHTGQMFFPEDLTERIAKLEPYSKRLSVHRTTQDEDQIFRSQHGTQSILAMERLPEGYAGMITMAIDPEATPAPVGIGGRGGRGRPF